MEKSAHKPRNRSIRNGLMRFSRARMIQKRAAYRHTTKKSEKAKKVTAKKEGKTARSPRAYDSPMKNRHEMRPHKCFSKQKRKLRKSITPGAVLILLTGRHKGKRVIFLKQLESGLLLVTGPFKVNGCPLRRVNQRFVIATKTSVDVSGINIPERVNDTYFRRVKAERQRGKSGDASGDIFAKNKDDVYTLTEERKEDQKNVDSQLLSQIRKREDGSSFVKYLGTMFSLSARQYPHNMVF